MSIASLSNKPDLNLNVGSLNCTALTINGVPPSGTGNFNNPSAVDLSMSGGGTKHNIGGVDTINSNTISINDATSAFTSTITGGTQTADLAYTLPVVAPTAGQVLSSDASGVMSWITGGGGGSVDNPMTVDLDAGNFAINDIGSLTLNDSTQSFTTSLACTAQTADIAYTLPGTAPTAGQVLSSDASGAMSWIANGSGSGDVKNPMIADLDGGQYAITNVTGIALQGASNTSPTIALAQSQTGVNSSTTLVLNPTQTGVINLVLPPALPTTGQVLSVASIVGGNTCRTAWVDNGSGGGVQNPMTSDLDANNNAITNVNLLTILDSTTNNTTAFIGGTQTADISYTLPSTAPTAGQVLSSNASGVMSWVANGSGSGDVKNPMIANLDAGNFDITKIKSLSLNNPAETFSTSLICGAQTADLAYTLPIVAPTVGQVLSSNASGVMSWVANGSSSGSVIKGYALAPKASVTTWTGGGITNLTTAIDCSAWTYPCLVTCNVFQFTLVGCTAPVSPASSVPAIYLASAITEAWQDVLVDASSYNATNNISVPSAQAGLNSITNQIKGFTVSAYLASAPVSNTIFLNCKPTANASFTSYSINGFLTVQPVN